ncbi:hypothetical protein EYF80_038789 [Liparis tanakae]|uniref:Uncharacterized protein n=1 Tax=Liparis tanakae TaxID=230148 RepID=A0A4Z2GBJ2_9TELE|nr:hypothetical protein EYF80_038789 [Liparis tanakae]
MIFSNTSSSVAFVTPASRQRAVAPQRAGCVFRCLESAAADVSSDVEPPPPRRSAPVCVTPDASTGGSCENTSSSGQRRQALIDRRRLVMLS